MSETKADRAIIARRGDYDYYIQRVGMRGGAVRLNEEKDKGLVGGRGKGLYAGWRLLMVPNSSRSPIDHGASEAQFNMQPISLLCFVS